MLTLRKQLEDDETDATGHLKGKLGFNTKQNSNELLKFLITAPDYWEDVNNGQPKGTIVPIEDLIDWIGHKGIDTKGIGAKSLAQVIQSIIKQKGTIKRFNYGGSRFLTNEINEQSMKDLSLLLANITGRIVGLSVAHNFKSIK